MRRKTGKEDEDKEPVQAGKSHKSYVSNQGKEKRRGAGSANNEIGTNEIGKKSHSIAKTKNGLTPEAPV